MLIPLVRDKNTIKVNHGFAEAVPEFAELLNEESLGVRYFAYVAYLCDPADDNIWFNLPEPIRKKELIESLGLESSLVGNKLVVDAIKKYRLFCEQSISYAFKASYNDGMRKVSEYVKGVKQIDDDNAKKFADVLGEMPKLLEGKTKLDKMGTKDEMKGRVRGEKKLTLNER